MRQHTVLSFKHDFCNATFLSNITVSDLYEREKNNGIKSQYLSGLKKAQKISKGKQKHNDFNDLISR